MEKSKKEIIKQVTSYSIIIFAVSIFLIATISVLSELYGLKSKLLDISHNPDNYKTIPIYKILFLPILSFEKLAISLYFSLTIVFCIAYFIIWIFILRKKESYKYTEIVFSLILFIVLAVIVLSWAIVLPKIEKISLRIKIFNYNTDHLKVNAFLHSFVWFGIASICFVPVVYRFLFSKQDYVKINPNYIKDSKN